MSALPTPARRSAAAPSGSAQPAASSTSNAARRLMIRHRSAAVGRPAPVARAATAYDRRMDEERARSLLAQRQERLERLLAGTTQRGGDEELSHPDPHMAHD